MLLLLLNKATYGNNLHSLLITHYVLQEPGVILLSGPGGGGDVDSDEEDRTSSSTYSDSEDSEVDVDRPVSPCNFTFIGANVSTGKSSLRSKPKDKTVKKIHFFRSKQNFLFVKF